MKVALDDPILPSITKGPPLPSTISQKTHTPQKYSMKVYKSLAPKKTKFKSSYSRNKNTSTCSKKS